MKKITIPMVLLVWGLPVMACGDDSEGGNEKENTAKLCGDDVDNDGDGMTDCDDDECTGLEVCDSTNDTEETESKISGIPVPATDDVPQPSGTADNLSVLDWAGFKAAVSYTFDDSQPSQMEHYDELQATGVRMTFFAGQGFGGGAEYDALWSRAVDDGHEIGNHTAHHCHINSEGTTISDCGAGTGADSPEAEITECTDYIESHFGQDGVYTMASPYGDSGWEVVAPSYVFLNRSVNGGSVGPNDNTDPFSLPTTMLRGTEDADTLFQYINRMYDSGKWLIFCIHSILPGANWYAGVEIDAITGSISRAKELDLWMDSMVNIGAYWMGQKLLTEASPEKSGDDTVWTWTLPDHFPPGKYVRVTVDGGTLSQEGKELPWSSHGYYEVALDPGTLTLSP